MPPIGLEPRAIVHAAEQPEHIQLRPPQKSRLAAQVLSRPRGNKLSLRRIRLTAAFGETSRPAVVQQHANGTQSELCAWRQQKQLLVAPADQCPAKFPSPRQRRRRLASCPLPSDDCTPQRMPSLRRPDCSSTMAARGRLAVGRGECSHLDPRREQFLNGVGSAPCRTGEDSATPAVGRNHGRTCSGTTPGSPPTAESEVCDAGDDGGRKRDVDDGVGMGGGDKGRGQWDRLACRSCPLDTARFRGRHDSAVR